MNKIQTAPVAKMAQAEKALTEKAQAKAAELAALEQGAGTAELTAALDGSVVDPQRAAKTARVKAEIAGIGRAIDEARAARREAIRREYQGEAQARRGRSSKLTAEATERQGKTDALLAQLREHEGIDYAPGPRPEYLGAMLGRALVYGVDADVSRTAAMLAEVETLEQEATDRESQRVHDSGTVQGDSAEALYAAVGADPHTIGPTLAAIETWAAEVEPPVKAEWTVEALSVHRPVSDFESVPKRYTLHWRKGEVNLEHSSLTLQEPGSAHGDEPGHEHPSEMGGMSMGDYGYVEKPSPSIGL